MIQHCYQAPRSVGRLFRLDALRVTDPGVFVAPGSARVDLIDWTHGAPRPFDLNKHSQSAGGGIATRLVSIEDFAQAEAAKRTAAERKAERDRKYPKPFAMLVGLACPHGVPNTPQTYGDGRFGSTLYERGCFSQMLADREYDVPILSDGHKGTGKLITWLGGDCRLHDDRDGLWLTIPLFDNPLDRRVFREVQNKRMGLSINPEFNEWETTLEDDVRIVHRVIRLHDICTTARPRFRQTWLRVQTQENT